MKSGIQLHTSYFPLAFMLAFCKPIVLVDNKPYRTSWGYDSLELPPGEYTIGIFFEYMFLSRCGENYIRVKVAEDQITRITYYMPPWIFSKGRMRADT